MQVILRVDVSGLGKRGDIVDVADGYARNYLLPKSKALKATEGAIAQAARMRRSRDLKDQADREAATTVASTLVPQVITIAAKTATGDRLFGSVSTADIAEAIADQTGIELDRRVLVLEEALKTVGTHTVMAELHPEVSFPVRVDIIDADTGAEIDEVEA